MGSILTCPRFFGTRRYSKCGKRIECNKSAPRIGSVRAKQSRETKKLKDCKHKFGRRERLFLCVLFDVQRRGRCLARRKQGFPARRQYWNRPLESSCSLRIYETLGQPGHARKPGDKEYALVYNERIDWVPDRRIAKGAIFQRV